MHIDAQSFSTDLYLDQAIHDRLGSLDADALDAPARRYLDDALLAFRRSGVDRDESTRERLRELNHRESELTQAFARGIRDGRRTTALAAADLAGLPDDYAEEHPPGDDGLVAVSTDYPDTLPFLTHATSPAARTAVLHSLLNVGWPDNDAVLAELLEVREQKAHLLGYDDWPSFDAEVKMIGSGPAIAAFIDDLAEATDAAGRREIEQLLEYARREGEDVIDFANWRHHLETLKRERFDVDAQQLRRYFDFRKVRRGLLDVTGRLFGLAYEDVAVPAWHPDVTSYDVRLVDSGELLGRIHLDLNPRDRKYNHAAQFTLVNGVLGRQLPEGALVCNFPRGLMDLDDVVTLFHEFGHLMHHMLAGRHAWARFSGVATEWDFVEAPSMMLEEWAWDPTVLRTFATDADGEPIPEDLVVRMRAADEFGKAFLTPHPDGVRRGLLLVPPGAAGRPDRPAQRADGALRAGRDGARHPLPHHVRPPRGVHLGLLHLRVVAGDRQGPVLRLRPRRPLRHRGRAPLPRPGARARRLEGRGRPRARLPGPALRRPGLPRLARA